MKILPNTIINFHEIHDKSWLSKTFELLKRNYNIITTKELENYYYNKQKLKNSCHITFDDGDNSFYNNIFPIVKKYNFPVSTYVSPKVIIKRENFWFQEIKGYNEMKIIELIKIITKNNEIENQQKSTKEFLKSLQLEVIWEIIRFYQKETNTPPKPSMNMTVSQLNEIKSSGLVEIGAHTLNHPILINEDFNIAKNEIVGSIDSLSEILDSEISLFAYPNGSFSAREIEILKNKDIKLAFTTQRAKITTQTNPLSIPRSGSPLISEGHNNLIYNYSKCIVQLIAGEKLFYKYGKLLNPITEKIVK